MVMEYAGGGDLWGFCEEQFERNSHTNGGIVLNSHASSIFRQMVAGVRHMHQRGLAHLDLKPENFVLSADRRTAKVIDFGMCHELAHGEVNDHRGRGTLNFAAPEIVTNRLDLVDEAYEAKAADVWALGAVLFFMALGNFVLGTPGKSHIPDMDHVELYTRRLGQLLTAQTEGRGAMDTICHANLLGSWAAKRRRHVPQPVVQVAMEPSDSTCT